MNLWRDLSPGPDPPRVINLIIEVPILTGSRNKYEYDTKMGCIQLNRVLYSPIHYPGDYGLIPQTLSEDGDPLDVLVMVGEPSFPGCIIQARLIGLFRMLDGEEPDDKVLAVPASAPFTKTTKRSPISHNTFWPKWPTSSPYIRIWKGCGLNPWDGKTASRHESASAKR